MPVDPIPPGVYFSIEHCNFYDAKTGEGMGVAFFEEWRGRRDIFPPDGQSALGLMEAVRVQRAHDATINTSDIQETTEDWFAKARWRNING